MNHPGRSGPLQAHALSGGVAKPVLHRSGASSLAASVPTAPVHLAPAGPSALQTVAQRVPRRPPSGGGGPAPSHTTAGYKVWPQFEGA